tara:strand:+ start:659 stop:1726 length:1068 start_codon:yes stop_codon:yes gene_type:complete
MSVIKSIRKLRILAFFLFLTPAIGLVGSLIIHNYLISFKFEKGYNYNFKLDKSEKSSTILCSKNNEFCKNRNIDYQKFTKLDQCYKNKISETFINKDGDKIDQIRADESNVNIIKDLNYEVYLKRYLVKELDKVCILNSNSLVIYNIFPFYYELIYQLKNHKDASFGTNVVVNPFFKGETSISNIVKRFPLNYFFKPVLYITVILMILYWYYFNFIFKKLTNNKKNYYFFSFGILSAIFLFFHVFFLGWTFDSEFLTKLRRSYVVFFILFEILAQAFLIRKVLLIKDQFIEYFNEKIIFIKLSFVIFICSSSALILGLLIFYNFSSNIDYILEWNYFLILLIFYFLSFLMWKKPN